ncbi:MAG: hypothetical protein NC924_05110, partial [Candidatus Omnitrophica bacterium]|nr:hypothetical protein [Candidatus Omnitrophota bacterium]
GYERTALIKKISTNNPNSQLWAIYNKSVFPYTFGQKLLAELEIPETKLIFTARAGDNAQTYFITLRKAGGDIIAELHQEQSAAAPAEQRARAKTPTPADAALWAIQAVTEGINEQKPLLQGLQNSLPDHRAAIGEMIQSVNTINTAGTKQKNVLQSILTTLQELKPSATGSAAALLAELIDNFTALQKTIDYRNRLIRATQPPGVNFATIGEAIGSFNKKLPPVPARAYRILTSL